MANNLKDAFEKHQLVAAELDRALRDCLAGMRPGAENAQDNAPRLANGGRFRVFEGGKRRQPAKM